MIEAIESPKNKKTGPDSIDFNTHAENSVDDPHGRDGLSSKDKLKSRFRGPEDIELETKNVIGPPRDDTRLGPYPLENLSIRIGR